MCHLSPEKGIPGRHGLRSGAENKVGEGDILYIRLSMQRTTHEQTKARL